MISFLSPSRNDSFWKLERKTYKDEPISINSMERLTKTSISLVSLSADALPAILAACGMNGAPLVDHLDNLAIVALNVPDAWISNHRIPILESSL